MTPDDHLDLEVLVFKRNVPAGMNYLLVAHFALLMRSSHFEPDPIIVRRVEGTEFYRIMDGRHRVVGSLVAGRTNIGVIYEQKQQESADV